MNIYGEEGKLSYLAPEMELVGIQGDIITASGNNDGGNNNNGNGDWGLGPLPG